MLTRWFVYIITNYNNTVLYIGITNNLERRIFEHKKGVSISSFSKKYRLYKLLWYQEFNSPLEAIEAEKKLKGWKRSKKIELIKTINPNFNDLSSALLDSSSRLTSGFRMTSRNGREEYKYQELRKNRLLVATRNPGKLREIKSILADLPIKIISLADIKYSQEIEEKGNSFTENAILKAKSVGRETGLLTLAEDSGLAIDILGGRPGVKSARYLEGSDVDRVNKVLDEVKNIPKEKRTAKFIAVVAIYNPKNNKVYTFEGKSRGIITDKPKGKNGFGYDPIFYNLDLGKTNGEASDEEKNRVSHRARALSKCKRILIRLISLKDTGGSQ